MFPRLSEDASDSDFDEDMADPDAESSSKSKKKEEGTDKNDKDDNKKKKMPKEVGFKYSGKETTSYGDWSHKGRVTDF